MLIKTELIREINTFLTSATVDEKTLIFLIKLKEKILKDFDSEEIPQNQKPIDVEKTLRSIGKRAFVDCYYILQNAKDGENERAVKLIERYGGAKNENSARTKLSIGKKIFKFNMNTEALKNIINSMKVDEETKNKALIILQKEEINS